MGDGSLRAKDSSVVVGECGVPSLSIAGQNGAWRIPAICPASHHFQVIRNQAFRERELK